VGARFLSRLFYFPIKLSLWNALKIWEGGGLVFYGGMIFGIFAVIIYAGVMRLSLLVLCDVLSPAVALGLAFGRIGCFLAGCCWGDVCVSPSQLAAIKEPGARYQIQTFPELCPPNFFAAVCFPPETGAYEQHQKLELISKNATRSWPVHPTQLYESFLAFGLCLFLNRAFRQRRFAGEVFCWFGMSYGVIRLAVEFLRADSAPIYLGALTLSQVISLIIASGSLILFLTLWRRRELLTAAG
ncbi:MAG: prolipoprotein diacylglyceryl transferase, partial [Limisphaerales bacterium]